MPWGFGFLEETEVFRRA